MVIGIDFTDEYTQISYFVEELKNPESISISAGEKKYLIPTVVCREEASGAWLSGERAVEAIEKGCKFYFKNFFQKAVWDEADQIEEKDFEYMEILKVFFRDVLAFVNHDQRNREIEKLVITIKEIQKDSVDVICDIFQSLGIEKRLIEVVSHGDSLGFYMLNQPKELRAADVVVLDFSMSHFSYRRFSYNSKDKPIIVLVEEHDWSEKIVFHAPDDEVLFKELQKSFDGRRISSVYLNGTGFSGNWMVKSLEFICSGRRAFKGQNLFSKGACYGGMNPEYFDRNKYLFLSAGRNMVSISLIVDKGSEKGLLRLSNAGDRWFESGVSMEGFLGEDRKIELAISSPTGGEKIIHTLELQDFPLRPKKTTRIEINFAYKDEHTLIVRVVDMGFGDFFRSSGKTVEEIIKISDYLG